MAKCVSCGAELEDGAKFCTACGAKQEGGTAQQNAQTQSNTQNSSQQGSAQESVKNAFASFNDTPDSTAEFDPDDIEKNRVMAILSYLSWLVLIPIFAAPNSKYARFHANQGLILAIAEVVWGVAYTIISAVVGVIFGLIGLGMLAGLIIALLSLISLAFFIISIIGIVNAANGKAKQLPLIGKFVLLK